MFDYGDNCPLTGMCYDYYLLKPIIDYYNAWCTYPEDFSLEDLMRQCYDNFFKSGYPVDVDLETEGFYRCNDANDVAGDCADFIFHKCNN